MKWGDLIEQMYNEQDLSRSVATTAAGTVGLAAYLLVSDAVVALFSAVIVFPLVRLAAYSLGTRWAKWGEMRDQFAKFSPQERQILEFFVHAGGACVSWGYVNRSALPFPRPALNSLIQRGIVCTSVMEDGMTESFMLDTDVFDMAQKMVAVAPDTTDQ